MAGPAFEVLGNAIRSRFATEVVAAPGSLITAARVAYDNAPFTEPPAAAGALWCRVSVREGETDVAELGGTRFRTVGVVMVQLFQPLNEGDALTRRLGDDIAAAFRAVTDSAGPVFGSPSYNTVGRSGPWHQANLVLPFYFDQT